MEKFIITIIFIFIASLICTLSIIPQILKVILKKQILDKPGGRKLHKNSTPSMGGVGIFFGFFLLSIFIANGDGFNNLNYFFFALIILFFTGLRDDLLPLAPRIKLLIQIACAIIVTGLIPLRIESLYSLNFLLGFNFPDWFSFSLTIFIIIAFTNAINLIDGIDGLAGSVVFLILTALAFWFAYNSFWIYAYLSASMLGALAGFLYYNWHPAKIFMGDTGSLIIGFSSILFAIIFLNLNQELSVKNQNFKIENSVTFLITLFIYPIFDVIRVIIIRLKGKRSPFSPDKLHIHLLLSRIGMKHNQIVAIILFFSIVNLNIFWIFSYLKINELIILLSIIIFCYLSNLLLEIKVKKFKKEKRLLDVRKIIKKS